MGTDEEVSEGVADGGVAPALTDDVALWPLSRSLPCAAATTGRTDMVESYTTVGPRWTTGVGARRNTPTRRRDSEERPVLRGCARAVRKAGRPR